MIRVERRWGKVLKSRALKENESVPSTCNKLDLMSWKCELKEYYDLKKLRVKGEIKQEKQWEKKERYRNMEDSYEGKRW